MGNYLKLFETHSEYEAYISGDMIKPNVSYCEDNNEVHYNPLEANYDYSQDYLTFVVLEDGTFTFTPQNSNVISYSTDNGTTWTEGNSVEVSNGDKVMWKGTMTPSSYSGIGTFSATGNFNVQGNAMSLLFGDNFKGQTDITGKNYAFYRLFYDNTKVINTENLSLSATTLASYCYYGMFQHCTSLTTAPELPATTLARDCYDNMFYDCTSLTSAPELPAITLAQSCYSGMFQRCTSLTTAPVLSATTLAPSCYSSMFNGCTSLTNTAIVPNSVKPISSAYCCSMYEGCNVPRSSDYDTVAYDGCEGGGGN